MFKNNLEMFPQTEVEKETDEKSNRDKKYIVLFLFSFMLAFGVSEALLEPASNVISFFNALMVPVTIAVAAGWCSFDYRHREGKTLHSGWWLGFMLFSPIALPWYFITTRGWRKGIILTAKSLFVFFIALSINVFSSTIIEEIIKT